MQSQVFAGMLLASAIAHGALGFVCGVIARATPRQVTTRIFMLIVFALAVCSGANAAAYLTSGDATLIAALRVAALGRAVAVSLILRLFYHVREGSPDAPLPGAKPHYVITALILGACALAFWLGPQPTLVRHPASLLGLLSVEEVGESATVASIFLSALTVAGSCLASWLAWTVWRRDGRSKAFFFGAALVSFTLAHDLLYELDWLPGPALASFAFVMLIIAIALPTMWRFLSIRAELEQRTTELKANEAVLVRSYEDLRATQDELVKKEQLAAVGELSAVIAHEVRNPLAIMSNAISTLRRPTLKADDRETLLAIIEEETSRLNRLVGDLLSYAKPVRVQRQLISLRELLGRTLKLYREARHDVELCPLYDEGVDAIWGDPTLLAGIVDNLINNAMQAMKHGGQLTVRLRSVTVGEAPGIELEIEDTGEGMSTIVRSRAMDPFFTTRPSGTGLGLAIVARVIDAHGGQIKIRSASDEGTVVHVRLPLSGEPASPARQGSANDGRLTEPPMLIEVRRALKSTGDFS